MDSAGPCRFNTLLPRSFPHVLEQIFFHLDYESFKTCFEVSTTWKELLTSESIQKKARDVFLAEIEEDEMQLMHASFKGNTKMIRRLLSTNMLDINSTSPLQMAAEMGFKEVVRLLIDSGANPNMADWHKNTPLHEAARVGHKDVIKMLLDGGADLNVADEGGDTPFYLAFTRNHKDVAQLLLEQGAKPHKEYYEWKLLEAIRIKGNVTEVKRLLSGGVDVNCGNSEPLKEAVRIGDIGIVHLLLSSGADPSEPLKEAVRVGHKGIVHLLLSSGADPNMTDANMEDGEEDGEQSPLRLALEDGKRALVRILLDAGAVPDDEDRELIDDWEWESDSDSDLDTLNTQYISEYGGNYIRQEDTYSYSSHSDLGRGKRQSSITKYFVRL